MQLQGSSQQSLDEENSKKYEVIRFFYCTKPKKKANVYQEHCLTFSVNLKNVNFDMQSMQQNLLWNVNFTMSYIICHMFCHCTCHLSLVFLKVLFFIFKQSETFQMPMFLVMCTIVYNGEKFILERKVFFFFISKHSVQFFVTFFVPLKEVTMLLPNFCKNALQYLHVEVKICFISCYSYMACYILYKLSELKQQNFSTISGKVLLQTELFFQFTAQHCGNTH